MGEILFNLLLFFWFVFVFINGLSIETSGSQTSARTYPEVVVALILLLLAFILLRKIRLMINENKLKCDLSYLRSSACKRLLAAFALLLSYMLLLDWTGFVATSIVFGICMSRLLGEKRFWSSFYSSVLVTLILYVIFVYGLKILLPRGTGVFRTFSLLIESLVR